MRAFCGVATVLFLAVTAIAETDLSLTTGAYAETNSFYQDKSPKSDEYVRIAPRLNHESDSGTVGLLFNGGGSYNKHLSFANQDYFDYDADAKIPINDNGRLSGYVQGLVRKYSEPAISNGQIVLAGPHTESIAQRNEYNIFGGNSGIRYRWSALSTFKLEGNYQTQAFNDSYYQYMNNYLAEGHASYEYQFLPETIFFVSGLFGAQYYPYGTINDPLGVRAIETKYGSTYYEGRVGIRGRLAERTRIDASCAYLVRQYEKSSGFSEPIFNLRIEEQLSPKDLLLAGYDYNVSDSKWTNYVIDQTTYIGYSRILGDQILLLGKMSYTYSSFSLPNKRDDQRLAGAFELSYSFSPKLKIAGVFDLDILNSDQINTDTFRQVPDATTSYSYFRSGIELTAYY